MLSDARLRATDPNKMLMLLFIASEATFFAFLILAYVYFRTFPESGPTAREALDPVKTGFFSLFLFASSGTMHLGQLGLREGRQKAFATWLLVTIVLGVVFLAGQASEWATLIQDNVTISRNLFGATFFTLTGLHGLHVLLGLVFLSIVLGISKDFTTAHEPAGVECVALYWHFVDVVWVVLFAIIYLGVFAG